MVDSDKLNRVPKSAGVYIFKNRSGVIIYIGKAQNLYNRVRSYFTRSDDIKVRALVKKIDDLEYFITDNEIEALLLENNLIKKHQPRYNIKLKDAKSYPMLKITAENLPRIIKCREEINETEEYFGPFISIQIVKLLLKIFSKVLKIRPCKRKFKPPYRYQPCLNYHIGKCSAPCASFISEEAYLRSIDTARNILKGNTASVIEILTDKMNRFSEKLDFENAAQTRDQIKILSDYNLLQYIDTSSGDNSDYIGIYSDFKSFCVSIIQQRSGKIIGKENFIVSNVLEFQDHLTDFLNYYYLNITNIAPNIYIPEEIENADILEKALNEKIHVKVVIKIPSETKDRKLLILAKQNAELYYEEKKFKLEKINILRELKKVLNLPKIPRIIEGIDIATLDGKYNVGALVNFIDGKPVNSNYRQFNIESKGHPDDYAMIEEVVFRRYGRLKNEKKRMPDLLMIDGGKGQINACYKSLRKLDINIPVIGLAKKEENIFILGKSDPVVLPQSSHALKLLQKVRDEAHRFGNIRLSKRHRKNDIKSELMKIKGIGAKRLNLLLKEFGSIKMIKSKSIEEISKAGGFSMELAEKVAEYLNR